MGSKPSDFTKNTQQPSWEGRLITCHYLPLTSNLDKKMWYTRRQGGHLAPGWRTEVQHHSTLLIVAVCPFASAVTPKPQLDVETVDGHKLC